MSQILIMYIDMQIDNNIIIVSPDRMQLANENEIEKQNIIQNKNEIQNENENENENEKEKEKENRMQEKVDEIETQSDIDKLKRTKWKKLSSY